METNNKVSFNGRIITLYEMQLCEILISRTIEFVSVHGKVEQYLYVSLNHAFKAYQISHFTSLLKRTFSSPFSAILSL